MVEVTKDYKFSIMCPTNGKQELSLFDLFFGRRQLIIYHFMFDPEWDTGCASCALLTDSLPPIAHLQSRSTNFVLVSRAPVEKIKEFQTRMGWDVPWASSHGGDFNYDFHQTIDEAVRPIEYNFKTKTDWEKAGFPASRLQGEQPGCSVFYRGDGTIGEKGKIYHTYTAQARGVELLASTFALLDMTPLGRQDGETGFSGTGFRLHDEYTGEDLKGLH